MKLHLKRWRMVAGRRAWMARRGPCACGRFRVTVGVGGFCWSGQGRWVGREAAGRLRGRGASRLAWDRDALGCWRRGRDSGAQMAEEIERAGTITASREEKRHCRGNVQGEWAQRRKRAERTSSSLGLFITCGQQFWGGRDSLQVGLTCNRVVRGER
jgi:hypothetical protein